MLTVYLYDGTPIDVWSDYDIPENSTLIPPTDGLYQPIKFDPETETWSGGDGYIPEPEVPEVPPTTPDPNLVMIAQLNMTVAKQSNLIKNQEKLIKAQNQQIADSYMALAKQNKKKESDKDGNE